MGSNPHRPIANGANMDRLINLIVSQFHHGHDNSIYLIVYYEEKMIEYRSLVCGNLC